MSNKQINYNSPHLFSYQRDVCNLLLEPGSNRTVVVKSRRQVGKSTMLAVILLYYAINFKKTKSYCLSPTLNQAKNVYQQIIDLTESAKGLIIKKNAQELEITLVNGSVIGFKSAAMGDRLRGYSVSGIMVIDEAAFISDEILPLVLPWRDFHKAPLLIVSTPFLKDGFFYRYYEMGLEGLNGITSVDWTDSRYQTELERILPPDRLAEYKATLPKNQYVSEYEGQFLDDDGMVFSGYKELIHNNSIQPGDRLYVGIDWSLGVDKDDTAISIINQKGQQVFFDAFNDLSPTQGVDRILGDITPYLAQIHRMQPETNSLGGVYSDMLVNKLPGYIRSRVFGFNTGAESKNAIVTNLQQAFEKQTINLLQIDKQTRQLGTYAMEFNPKTRRISYNAPTGLHDDTVIALMLSWDSYLNANASGIYSISVV